MSNKSVLKPASKLPLWAALALGLEIVLSLDLNYDYISNGGVPFAYKFAYVYSWIILYVLLMVFMNLRTPKRLMLVFVTMSVIGIYFILNNSYLLYLVTMLIAGVPVSSALLYFVKAMAQINLWNYLSSISYLGSAILFIVTAYGFLNKKIAIGVIAFFAATMVIRTVLFDRNDPQFFLLVIYYSLYFVSVMTLIPALQPGDHKQESESNPMNTNSTYTSYGQPDWTQTDPNIDPALLEERSIITCILFVILTCGIYSLFWIYALVKKIRLLNNDRTDFLGEYLCLIFVPFYVFYWLYTRGQKLYQGAADKGIALSENSLVYLLLAIFGLSIVSYCLIQNDLNTIAQALRYNAANPVQKPTPQPMPQPEPVITPEAESKSTENHFETLNKLADLRDKGIITEEEFAAKKKSILDKI